MSTTEDKLLGSTSPLRYVLILAPFAVAALIGVFTMGTSDTANVM